MLNEECMENMIDIDKRLEFKYLSETNDEYYLTVMLDCYIHAIANGIKSNFGNELDLYKMLAEDITLYMETDEEENIKYLSTKDSPNQYIKSTVYENASLEMLERFLDDGKIVVINTLHHELKFFKYYNISYNTQNPPSHPFVIIHHDIDNLYYIESLDFVHKENYKYYKDNKSVGVIEKAYMKPIFDRYLVCFTIDIDFNRLDLFTERFFALLRNYVDLTEKDEVIDGINYFHGTSVLKKLRELCDIGGNNSNNAELIAGTKYILRMRIFMKECLMKLAGNKSFVTITREEVYNAFQPAEDIWVNLMNILVKRNLKTQLLLDKGLVEYFDDLVSCERKVVRFISKLLRNESDFCGDVGAELESKVKSYR